MDLVQVYINKVQQESTKTVRSMMLVHQISQDKMSSNKPIFIILMVGKLEKNNNSKEPLNIITKLSNSTLIILKLFLTEDLLSIR